MSDSTRKDGHEEFPNDSTTSKNLKDQGGESLDRGSNNMKRRAELDELREKSSYEYLQKREAERVALHKRKIADEEALFDEQELTFAEKAKRAAQRKIRGLIEQHRHVDDRQQYEMPSYTNLGQVRDKGMPSGADDWEHQQIQKNIKQAAKSENFELLHREIQISELADTHIELRQIPAIEKELLKRQEIEATRKSLPVYGYRDAIIEAVAQNQVLVLVGETGSGKTTQIPQYLIEAGYTKAGKKIGCTQPRRVAAMSVAARVAEEMRVKLGHEVGYSIRFEDCTSDRTILKYMTDGMLLREFLNEPDLSGYGVLIIDEAHERTLHTDILFGLVKEIIRFRDDLKLIISSATLDAEKFSDFFDGAPILTVPGRRFEVDVYYSKEPESDYLSAALKTIMQIHTTQPRGDILVFLTGQEEIELLQENLLHLIKSIGNQISELIVAPIYSSLPSELQSRIFSPTPPRARKVVLATNIAETSITIDGIAYVIDTGLCKQKEYNPKAGMESLVVVPCSKASANQRMGRAGRVGPGKCFRLYTSWSFNHELEPNTTPEIQRTNLANVVLLLKSIGIQDLVNFPFLDPPNPDVLRRALEELYALDALNSHGELTSVGKKMAELPIDPMMSKALIAAGEYKCSEEVLSIISMLSSQGTIFHVPPDRKMQAEHAKLGFACREGDHLSLLNIWQQWVESGYSAQWCFENFIQHRSLKRVRDVREQLSKLIDRAEIILESSADTVGIRKAMLSGYFLQVASIQASGESYRTAKQKLTVYIHPGSLLAKAKPKWVMYHELVLTSREYMRQVTEIEPEWLLEVAPSYYSEKDLDVSMARRSMG